MLGRLAVFAVLLLFSASSAYAVCKKCDRNYIFIPQRESEKEVSRLKMYYNPVKSQIIYIEKKGSTGKN